MQGHILCVKIKWLIAGGNENNNNNNNNNPICKAPECQKTSVALKSQRERALKK